MKQVSKLAVWNYVVAGFVFFQAAIVVAAVDQVWVCGSAWNYEGQRMLKVDFKNLVVCSYRPSSPALYCDLEADFVLPIIQTWPELVLIDDVNYRATRVSIRSGYEWISLRFYNEFVERKTVHADIDGNTFVKPKTFNRSPDSPMQNGDAFCSRTK